MLQQTQVATVVPYFTRFMTTFPTIRTLAEAEERDVLRHWEGLGYYRRARQMHRAAGVLAERHGGTFPREMDAVRALPGIGRYTAGAIVSIAFDASVPILEANTVRLFSRLAAFRGALASARGQKRLWELAAAVLPASGCSAFNQALMELGSLVCTPREPACPRCPVQQLCAARQLGLQNRIPRPQPKPRVEAVREATVVVWRGNRVLLRRRTPSERWAGLWDFVRFELDQRSRPATTRELREQVLGLTGLTVTPPERMATLQHGVTRFRITLDCYAARCPAGKARLARGEWRWVRPGALDAYPLSVTGARWPAC